MITSQEYSNIFHEIKHLDYSSYNSNPNKEKVFYVNLDSRTITVPSDFQQLAVVGDHCAETVWFAVNRYYDGEDLYNKPWAVQAVDAAQRSLLLFIEKQKSPILSDDLDNSNLTLSNGEDILLLGWPITRDITSTPGNVAFSLCCFDFENPQPDMAEGFVQPANFKYRLGTESVSCQIVDSIYITDVSENLVPSPSRIEELIKNAQDLLGVAGTITIDFNQINANTVPKIDNIKIDELKSSSQFTNIYYNQIKNTPVYYIDDKMLTSGPDNSFSSANFTNLDFKQLANVPTMNGNPLAGDSDITYANLADKPVLQTDEEGFIIGIDEYEISKVKVDIDLDETSENPVQNKVITTKVTGLQNKVDLIEEKLSQLTYAPLKVLFFTNNMNYVEKNSPYNGDVTFEWKIDGNVMSQTLGMGDDIRELTKDDTSYTGNFGNLTDTTEFMLTAIDGAGNPTKETSKIIFTYKVFYGGVDEMPIEYNTDFLLSLNNNIQETSTMTFNVNCGESGQYVYFAAPQEYNVTKDSFASGGFTGGFGQKKIAEVTYNEVIYDIWKTDNKIKNSVEITVR